MKKSINFSLLITYLFLSSLCYSQGNFQYTIGRSSFDYGESITKTIDGGYAVAGYTQLNGSSFFDVYVAKLEANNTLAWTKIIGQLYNDFAYSIIQTIDGGYAIAGSTDSLGSNHTKIYIIKINSLGNIQWTKTYGGNNNDYGSCIIQTSDGGYALSCGTYSFGAGLTDAYVIKLDSSGIIQWTRTIGGTQYDGGNTIIQTLDGGYAIAGSTISFGFNMYFIKLDLNGNIQWAESVGGSPRASDGKSIVQSNDGGYVLTGGTYEYGAGDWDVYITKFDINGNLIWTRTVGGVNYDIGNSITKSPDGGYAICGYTESYGMGGRDVYLVKVDGNGILQWTKTIGGTGNEEGNSIVNSNDGGYVIAGYSSSFGAGNTDIYIIKLDSNGNTCGNTSSGGISGSGGSVINGGYSGSGGTIKNSNVGTESSGGTLTIVCVVGVQESGNNVPENFYLSQNFPNPFNPSTKIRFALPNNSFIKIIVYDIIGNEVGTIVDKQLNAGTYETDFDGTNLSSGVYYYKLIADDLTETKKMVLLK